MPILYFSSSRSVASSESVTRAIAISPRLCAAMILAMNVQCGLFTRAHLAKVRKEHGPQVFDGELREFVQAVLRDGSAEVAFAPCGVRPPRSTA